LIGKGNGNDSPMFGPLMASIYVPRPGPGRPRSRPDTVLGDKAYSARAHREHLRGRGIKTVIPEPSDQIGHRLRRGSAGGRPVDFDADAYRGRNVVERAFNRFKNWRAIATRYDKHAVNYRAGVVIAAIILWLHE
jgi:transposase